MRLLRLPEVIKTIGFGSRTTIWRAVRRGDFPAPVIVGSNSICWRADEIDAWVNALPRRSYGAAPKAPGEERAQ
jgi:prophage regulatory protein